METITSEAITASHNPDLVSLVKDYAVFLFRKGVSYTVPTSTQWDAGDAKPIGYNSEDGAVLHPEAGDSTDFNGHNGDIVKSKVQPGYWTLQLAGIKCRRSIAEAYFGVTIGEDGAIHVDSAANDLEYGLVLVGVTDSGDPIVLSAEKVQVSEREDVTLVSTELVSFGITFRLARPSGSHMFSLYGLFAAEDRDTPATTKTVTALAVSGETNVTVNGTTQLTATATYSDGSSEDVTSLAQWMSGTAATATVDTGLVTGVKSGTTDIKATYQDVESEAFKVTVAAAK